MMELDTPTIEFLRRRKFHFNGMVEEAEGGARCELCDTWVTKFILVSDRRGNVLKGCASCLKDFVSEEVYSKIVLGVLQNNLGREEVGLSESKRILDMCRDSCKDKFAESVFKFYQENGTITEKQLKVLKTKLGENHATT